MRSCRARQCASYARQIRWRGAHISSPAVGFVQGRCLATEARPASGDLSIPTKARFNDIGVQQVSQHVFPQLFSGPPTSPPPEYIALSKDHLGRHDLLGKNTDTSPPIGFDLPPIHGTSLDEHFHKLGMDASEPYLTLARKLAYANPPPKPRKWDKRSGWTKYYPDGTSEAVESPDESAITFDTEVIYKETPFPAMACAVSATAWYGWLSPWLLGESNSDRHLIPLGDPAKPRIIVGHNIGYDRARTREEYSLAQSKNYFMDTMSLHVAVNGMCSRQRPTWMKQRKARDMRDDIASSEESADLDALIRSGSIPEEEEHLWVGRSSVNSLRDVAQFHCGITLDKERRELFGELDREGILEKYDELLDYCAADVEVTHKVYRKVFPAFMETCPHPVSFAALRHLSAEILPVNETWQTYIQNAEDTYSKASETVIQRLIELAEIALKLKDDPSQYEQDPWLRQLNWSGQEIKMAKPKRKGEEPRPVKRQKMPGMPQWYKDLFPVKDGPINLTVRTRAAPLLLRLSWDNHPLVWSDKHGWTFCVPLDKAETYTAKAVTECYMDEEENPILKNDRQHRYFKLPHKDGPLARCASPLAKGYLAHFEKGTLSSEYALAKEALEMNASCSYWISARERIRSQMVVYNRDLRPTSSSSTNSSSPSTNENGSIDNTLGFILPQLIPMGTITRRAVENTWLTASNAKPNRVGSELKSMIRAPPGYTFVGADVDSQELWIASLMGDAQFKQHGGNAIGFMTLEGTKAQGTDMHSRTAGILGISRNDAKVFNYGRIYGAGLNFAGQLLKQFNPDLTPDQASKVAQNLYTATKGSKTLRKAIRKSGFWRGGTESFVFNTLEDFAEQETPRTPVLGAGITEALMRRFISKGEFMTSRVNWAIQSSGVDYLHLLIVSMDYLTRRYNINARVALTVHDEIRYLVKEEDRYRAAMALQVANVWTRAMFSQQMGIDDLPQSCAYFSGVDVDKVLRKEVDMDCVTPSHTTKIPPGESLDVVQLLAKGEEARLDEAIVADDMPHPEKYEYTPREPVMKALMKGTDINYVRAQIANDEELKQLVKEYKNPTLASSTDPSSSASGASDIDDVCALEDLHLSSTPSPRRRTSSSTTPKPRTPRTPKAPKSPKSPKLKPFKKMTTPKHLQPQGVHLQEVPSWHEHRLAGFAKEAATKAKWGLENSNNNNGTSSSRWVGKR